MIKEIINFTDVGCGFIAAVHAAAFIKVSSAHFPSLTSHRCNLMTPWMGLNRTLKCLATSIDHSRVDMWAEVFSYGTSGTLDFLPIR